VILGVEGLMGDADAFAAVRAADERVPVTVITPRKAGREFFKLA